MADAILLCEITAGRNLLLATCLNCWHQRVLEPRDLERRFGARRSLAELAPLLRCLCGARRAWLSVRLGTMGFPPAATQEEPWRPSPSSPPA